MSLKVAAFSRHTLAHYGASVRDFCIWLSENECRSPAAITPELCMAYQKALYFHRDHHGRGFAAATQIHRLSAVRQFTRFLKRAGYALVDAGLAVQMPRPSKRLPRGILSEEDMAKILSMPDVRTLRGYRDRTILEVLYSTGIRSGELGALDIGDFDFGTGRLCIRAGKGKKDRVVPIGAVATEYLAGYIRNVRPRFENAESGKALFLSWTGKRLVGKTFVGEMQKYIQKAGIEWRVVPHALRHTCATHMLRRGANLKHIQEILGHESLATTEKYTRVEIGDLQDVHEKFHPREKL